MDKLVIYGDFNCPYSALASHRADILAGRGLAQIEFRAVEHDPDMPTDGEELSGDRREDINDEVRTVLGLIKDGENPGLHTPGVRPNTAVAVATYATLDGEAADAFRRAAFRAIWTEGRNLSSAEQVASLGVEATRESPAAERWQQEWEGMDKRLVPMVVLPDGYVSRGLGALKRMADMLGPGPV